MHIDPHCHLDDPRFEGALDALLSEAEAAGVDGFLIPGVDPHKPAKKLLCDIARCKWAIGLHPWRAATLNDAELKADLKAMINALDAPLGPCAVGEIGLDLKKYGRETLDAQLQAFRATLALARAYKKPVILHVVSGHQEALEILKRDHLPAPGGVLHSCSASAEQLKAYLALGLCVSFTAAIARPDAHKLHKALISVPQERLMLETDAPDQGFDRNLNSPAALPRIAEAAAELRNTAPEALLNESDLTCQWLFGRF